LIFFLRAGDIFEELKVALIAFVMDWINGLGVFGLKNTSLGTPDPVHVNFANIKRCRQAVSGSS